MQVLFSCLLRTAVFWRVDHVSQEILTLRNHRLKSLWKKILQLELVVKNNALNPLLCFKDLIFDSWCFKSHITLAYTSKNMLQPHLSSVWNQSLSYIFNIQREKHRGKKNLKNYYQSFFKLFLSFFKPFYSDTGIKK